MNPTVPVDAGLKDVCREIVDRELSEQDWAALEDPDCFRSSRYFGGYDAAARIFRFSWIDPAGEQVTVGFSLADASRILNGELTEVPLAEPAETGPRKVWVLKLLLALVVAAAIAGAIFERLSGDPAAKRRAQALADIAEFEEALERWQTVGGEFPMREPGFMPPDPWGTPYRIDEDGDATMIVSAGPDRRFGTGDDLSSRRSATSGEKPRE